jgi:hypothetical protein
VPSLSGSRFDPATKNYVAHTCEEILNYAFLAPSKKEVAEMISQSKAQSEEAARNADESRLKREEVDLNLQAARARVEQLRQQRAASQQPSQAPIQRLADLSKR